MNKSYFDLCYEILKRYLGFPDVAGTAKDIKDHQERMMKMLFK